MFNFFKKRNINKKQINKVYSQHLYTGINGVLMRYCHRQLEEKLPFRKYNNVLEIGAGSQPHFNYLKQKDCNYHILETMRDSSLKKKFAKNLKYKFYNGKIIPFKNNYFDRIILSHTLEHIIEPEKFLKEIFKKLKKGGVASVSLPTDPGLLWRLGRSYNKIYKVKNNLRISNLEYDYMNSIEHVNSIYNLLNIIRHNYKGKIVENFLPFKIKHPDINLFYNVHIVK
ncbi:class I SAM-dependent methyltransferase [Pelagibacteraceae bacterium]|nr:class I SAM-dependent methyltransferase [Pelagibacteraceae bacterium]